MKRRVLVALILAACGLAQAQPYSRAELKQPLSETVEKALAEFVEQCVPEKEKQLVACMEESLQSLNESVRLSDDESAALKAKSKEIIVASLKSWQPLAVVMMRTYLQRTSDTSALRHIATWKPEKAGPGEPIEGWVLPDETPDWLAALKSVVGEERLRPWLKAQNKARRQAAKEISDYLERWIRESRGPMNEDLQARIAMMKETLKLPESDVTAVEKVAEATLDRICDAEKKRAAGMLRSLPTEARQELMGRSYFYVRFDRPRGTTWDKAWDEAVAGVLTKEQFALWQKAEEEERAKAEEELADMIKPSEQQAEQRMDMTMVAEVENIVLSLELPKERQQELEKLSKVAVKESLAQARQGWMKQARNYSPSERKRIGGNVYFGINEEQQAQMMPVWLDGLKKLLSEEERTRMKRDNDARENRTSTAISRACLAEMDEMLMLDDVQRAKLEPLLLDVMRPFTEQRRQQYWSYSTSQLFQAAGKIDAKQVQAILDAVQQEHWKKLINTSSSSSRRSNTAEMNDLPEVPDMEAAISAHLYKMFVEERKKMLGAMMPHVEDAVRVLSLPEPVVAQLTTAAKGAVEDSMQYWRKNTDRYVRQAVQTATPKNIAQALAGAERISYGRTQTGPEDTDLWKDALDEALNDDQQKRLQQVVNARQAYRLKAMAAMSVSELDRRRRLNSEQCARIETLVHKVLSEYLPDIERYMSQQWFLQYYYAMVPVAGVPEKDMKAILTPEQWKLCKERDLPDAEQYWEGIRNNHEQRLKQKGAQGGNRQLFIE